MRKLFAAVLEIRNQETGQDLAEYSLILAFILAAAVVVVTALGLAIAGSFGSILGSF